MRGLSALGDEFRVVGAPDYRDSEGEAGFWMCVKGGGIVSAEE